MRVVLADDAVLFRRGLAALLHDEGHEVVAEAGDPDTLMEAVARHAPDLACVDIRMPPTWTTEGLRAAVRIRAEHPAVAVLVLSQFVETAHAVTLLTASPQGVGYLLKDRVGAVDELTDAMARVSAGGTVIDPEVVSVLIDHKGRSGRLDYLTSRERSVLELMAEGLSNQAISERLFLAERTVETHITSIFTKLDIAGTVDGNRRVLAVLAFLRG